MICIHLSTLRHPTKKTLVKKDNNLDHIEFHSEEPFPKRQRKKLKNLIRPTHVIIQMSGLTFNSISSDFKKSSTEHLNIFNKIEFTSQQQNLLKRKYKQN